MRAKWARSRQGKDRPLKALGWLVSGSASHERRQALRTLLRANKGFSTAHLPKDSFGPLQSYMHECSARRVFRELARIAQTLAIEAMPEIRRDKTMGPELPPAP